MRVTPHVVWFGEYIHTWVCGHGSRLSCVCCLLVSPATLAPTQRWFSASSSGYSLHPGCHTQWTLACVGASCAPEWRWCVVKAPTAETRRDTLVPSLWSCRSVYLCSSTVRCVALQWPWLWSLLHTTVLARVPNTTGSMFFAMGLAVVGAHQCLRLVRCLLCGVGRVFVGVQGL